MSWSKAPVFLLLFAALAGCGFEPLYAPTTRTRGAADFSTVYVAEVPDRSGQQFRNALLDLINPRGEPSHPVYVLKAQLSESEERLAVQKTASATRANLRMHVLFSLTRVDTKETIWSGSATSVASYNVLDSEYGTLRALANVRERSLRQLAENVRVRLGIFFHRGEEERETSGAAVK